MSALPRVQHPKCLWSLPARVPAHVFAGCAETLLRWLLVLVLAWVCCVCSYNCFSSAGLKVLRELPRLERLELRAMRPELGGAHCIPCGG